ncbi:hypothetical protein EVAR_83493_1 [Eumeta japonica]|uniref:Uncharacterized protein n=1 Tax=Eumeta variegata TaxID=151549 RepID=A0A4C1XXQ8_EUMVA|nr:hypothetical protein EVAR_83493_1 [Eumeta japonica]
MLFVILNPPHTPAGPASAPTPTPTSGSEYTHLDKRINAGETKKFCVLDVTLDRQAARRTAHSRFTSSFILCGAVLSLCVRDALRAECPLPPQASPTGRRCPRLPPALSTPCGRSRTARAERLDEEYYTRERYARYPRDHYAHEGYPPHDPYEREPYGHDYTRDAYQREEYARDAYQREEYARDAYTREGYSRDAYTRDERAGRARAEHRDPPDEFGPSRRALNAI